MTDGPLSDKAAHWRQAIDAAVKAVLDKSGKNSNKWQDVERMISNISSLPVSDVVVTYLSDPKHTKNRLRQRAGSHLRLLLAADETTLNSARQAIRADDGLGGVPVLLAEVTADGGARLMEVLVPRPPPAPGVSALASALKLPLTEVEQPADQADAGSHGASAELATTSRRPEAPDVVGFSEVVARLRREHLTFPTDLVASFLLALQARRFVLLTGISGTGKTELALHVARVFSPPAITPGTDSDEASEAVVPGTTLPVVPSTPSYELVAVRPDWTDNRALLGFYNPLTNDYSTTPTLQLVLRAAAEADQARRGGRRPRPFFLILDEMNLARAEHYFSDFLSAMESGEPIHLHDDDDLADGLEAPTPKRVTLPPNLFVVGTVNVDETTHMFSPKILDRAFVLEFNDVDLDGLSMTVKTDLPPSPLTLTRMPGALDLLAKSTSDDWVRFESLRGGELRSLLGALHEVLEQRNRHFGYRVAREVARFTTLAADQTSGGDDAILAAFDVAVFSKVLPKLHGTQAELEALLQELFKIAAGEAVADIKWQLQRGRLVGPDNLTPRLPWTATKLWRMQRQLRDLGFVSFVE